MPRLTDLDRAHPRVTSSCCSAKQSCSTVLDNSLCGVKLARDPHCSSSHTDQDCTTDMCNCERLQKTVILLSKFPYEIQQN
ncbi:hypothetical protein AMECASPLE_003690 [Ameca splendens]|uniref:Uncharacterized protein n=1 Tax=Ameca splendens TaxID=208324 RepID=A0ABV1A4W5_9TELE